MALASHLPSDPQLEPLATLGMLAQTIRVPAAMMGAVGAADGAADDDADGADDDGADRAPQNCRENWERLERPVRPDPYLRLPVDKTEMKDGPM